MYSWIITGPSLASLVPFFSIELGCILYFNKFCFFFFRWSHCLRFLLLIFIWHREFGVIERTTSVLRSFDSQRTKFILDLFLLLWLRIFLWLLLFLWLFLFFLFGFKLERQLSGGVYCFFRDYYIGSANQGYWQLLSKLPIDETEEI